MKKSVILFNPNGKSENISDVVNTLSENDILQLTQNLLQQNQSNLEHNALLQNLNSSIQLLNDSIQQLLQQMPEKKVNKKSDCSNEEVIYIKPKVKHLQQKQITFKDFTEKYYNKSYENRLNGKKKCEAEIINRQKFIIGHFGDMLLSNITMSDAHDFVEKLKTRNPTIQLTTIKRYLRSINAIMNYAVKFDFIEKNVIAQYDLKAPDVNKERRLSKDEVDLLLFYCKQSKNKNLYPIVQIALNTGMRKGEIVKLKKDDIITNSSTTTIRIRAENAKACKERTVPANNTLCELINKQISTKNLKDDDLLFEAKSFKSAFVNIVKKMESKHGVKHFRFHDLRHTTASNLIDNAISPSAVSKILGHSTIRMIERYIHCDEHEVSRAVNSLDKK